MSEDDSKQTYPVPGWGDGRPVRRDGDRITVAGIGTPLGPVLARRLGQAMVTAATDAATHQVAAFREVFPEVGEIIVLHGRDRYADEDVAAYQAAQPSGCCAQSPEPGDEARLCDEIAKHNDAIQALRDRYPDSEDGGPAKTVRPIWVENAISNLRRARNEVEHELRAATGG